MRQCRRDLSWGGETRLATILVCHVPALIAEKEISLAARNDLLSVIVDAISERTGMTDKFLFDGVVGFWNVPLSAPDHPRLACEAALAIVGSCEAYCAVNTGEVFVGTVGSPRRMDYSAVGDPVTVTYLLAAHARRHHLPVLLGEQTYQSIQEQLPAKDLGALQLEGRQNPVSAYALEISQA